MKIHSVHHGRVPGTLPGQSVWKAGNGRVEECCPGPIPEIFLNSVCVGAGCAFGRLGMAAREVAGRRHDLMAQEDRARREAEARKYTVGKRQTNATNVIIHAL